MYFLIFCVISDEDALLNSKCPKNLELRWQTEVSSSIYASPLIADINRYKQIHDSLSLSLRLYSFALVLCNTGNV